VTWHSFRHTNATLADQAGLTDTERQRVLGHASDRMTRHYSHADLERVRAKLNEVCARLLAPEQLSLLQ
jgi:integrase